MSTYRLPPIDQIRTLPTTAHTHILDALFEPSTPLYTLSLDLLHTKEFSSYDDLITAIGKQLTDLLESGLTSEWLDKILSSHPRLGEQKINSEQSRAEQAQLNTGGGEDEAEKLRLLNVVYEEKFPGLRYV